MHFIARCEDYEKQRKEVYEKIKEVTGETVANYKRTEKEKWLLKRILGSNEEQVAEIRRKINKIAANYLKQITAERDRKQKSNVFKTLKHSGTLW